MNDQAPVPSSNMPPRLPAGSGPQINTLLLLADSALTYTRMTLLSAAWQLITHSFLLAALMWLCGEQPLRIVIMLEVFLISLLGWRELRRVSESSRKMTLVLSGLNFTIVAIFSLFIGNLLLLIGAAVAQAAFWVILLPKNEQTGARKRSWIVLMTGYALLFLLTVYARFEMGEARADYEAENYEAAYGRMQWIGPIVELRGGTKAERALILFRQAELAYRHGQAEEAHKLLERCDRIALKLTVPPETQLPDGNVRRSLAFVLVNHAVLRLKAGIHTTLAWGRFPELDGDPLATAIITPHDGVSWGW